MDIIGRRLRLCGEIETRTALMYQALEVYFPAEGAFFHRLARSEENHAELVEKAKIFHTGGVLPSAFVPDSTLELEHTLHHLQRRQKLLSDGVSLEEGCRLALEIENLTGEKYLQEVIHGKVEVAMNKEIAELLRILVAEEKLHAEIIKEFMASKSFQILIDE